MQYMYWESDWQTASCVF